MTSLSPGKEEKEGQERADRERHPDVRDEVAVRHERDPEKELPRLAVPLAIAERGEPHQTEEDRDQNRRERDVSEIYAARDRTPSVSGPAEKDKRSRRSDVRTNDRVSKTGSDTG
jgi:hypothetical protein